MSASVQFRPQNRDFGMVMREVDEDLAIFLGIRNSENPNNVHLKVEDSNEFDDSKGEDPNCKISLTSNAPQPEFVQIAADDNFLKLENERSDFDWLLTQADTSLLPSTEINVQDSVTTQTDISKADGISQESKLATSTTIDSSNKRFLSSGNRKPTPRASTPTSRVTGPAKSKPSRSSTPTSRPTMPSSKPVTSQPRSSTPAKTTSRSSTPTRKPVSAPNQSSSVRKTGTTLLKNPMPSSITSSRPLKPLEKLSVSHNGPQTQKVIMPKRPASASRGRPSAILSSSNGKPRQKSLSPVKVRAPSSAIARKNGSLMVSRSRGQGNGGDEVNPVLMGTKMVERVVNMRKLAPPKQDDNLSNDNSLRKSSQFGRSLSKKSLDMAMRHMDIRRSIPLNLRPVATGVSYSSSLGSSQCKSSSSISPMASCSDSSESSSVSINSRFLNRTEIDD
ncbi:hypothetical protein ACJIZ3_023998 [Penstemon smallii]|uniref:Uncharacterized protein n=1 Tax=Penstemon smallii TaxID=265156 RepID=A0ABD3TSZ5_9LAMI